MQLGRTSEHRRHCPWPRRSALVPNLLLGFKRLASDVSKRQFSACHLARHLGKESNTGDLAYWLSTGAQHRTDCWHLALERKTRKGSVHRTSGPNALDDLLSQVAPFAEVQRLGLPGLLRQLLLAQVDAELRRPFEQPQHLKGASVGFKRTLGQQCRP